jgi:Core-2/I-Branching enzyme
MSNGLSIDDSDFSMRAPLGFIILSHAELEPLKRLIRALNRAYNDPPIAIHHDFSQSRIDVAQLRGDIRLVNPSLITRWGDISLVHATLAALRELYDNHDPDWFTLLSTADYPTMPARQVISELQKNQFDAYLDYVPVERFPANVDTIRLGRPQPEWQRNAYDRYVAATIKLPSAMSWPTQNRPQIVIRSNFLLAPFLPYSRVWKCYAGDFWFTANRTVAGILLSDIAAVKKTLRHLRKRFAADETFHHTVLANHTALRICTDNKRYTKWLLRAPNPKVLEITDLPDILQAKCHFARKFSSDSNSTVLDELDRLLDHQ